MDDDKEYHPQLKARLDSLTEKHDFVVTGKDDLERLLRSGVADPQTQKKTLADVFDERKQKAHQILDNGQLELPLPETPFTELNHLIKEIYEAALFGLNHAAITLCGSMVEYAFKLVLYVRETHSVGYDKASWDAIVEGHTLGSAIKEGKRKGLLNDQSQSLLTDYKNTIRNPYVHYNLKKITAGSSIRNVTILNMYTLEERVVDIEAEEDKVIQNLIKQRIDSERVFWVIDQSMKLMHKCMAHIEFEQEKVALEVSWLFFFLVGRDYPVELKWIVPNTQVEG